MVPHTHMGVHILLWECTHLGGCSICVAYTHGCGVTDMRYAKCQRFEVTCNVGVTVDVMGFHMTLGVTCCYGDTHIVWTHAD